MKQLFDSVFVISRIIKVLVSYQPQPWLWLITPTSTLIILDMTLSNNMLVIMSLAEGWGICEMDPQSLLGITNGSI